MPTAQHAKGGPERSMGLQLPSLPNGSDYRSNLAGGQLEISAVSLQQAIRIRPTFDWTSVCKEAVVSSERGTEMPSPSTLPADLAGLWVVGGRAKGAARDGGPTHDQINHKAKEITGPLGKDERRNQ